MNMNASYNKLVTKHLTKAQIVYDRFHMQSQFGRDVLGVVRLDEARRHKAKEKEILVNISNDTDKDTMKSLKQEAKSEKQGYSQLKKRACKRCSGQVRFVNCRMRKEEHIKMAFCQRTMCITS